MFMAHDGYGNHYFIKKHPRKELCEQLGRQHVDKIYEDRHDGTYHIGYIIAGHWLTVFGLEGNTFATKT
jgi:hypothetical protein